MGPEAADRDAVRHAAGDHAAKAVDHGLRRMIGLFAFTYLCVHFLTWLVLDQWFDLAAIGADLVKRPYIMVGFTASHCSCRWPSPPPPVDASARPALASAASTRLSAAILGSRISGGR